MKKALAGKFLPVFLFWCCVQAIMVMPATPGQTRSCLETEARADTISTAPARQDSVRVLPDDFLSGNSGSVRPDAEKARGGVSQNPAASVPSEAESATSLVSEDGWDLMPAGAKPAYMGIHGGTMPVSLLVSNDGNSLLTFVGRTGNDFLDMLRRTELPLPSLFNSTEGRLPVDFQAGLAGARVLSAGSGQYRMPVLCLTSDAFARIAPTPDMLQPFGLSDKPLALEGEVLPPDKTTPAKQFRMFFQPQYLQPKANRQ